MSVAISIISASELKVPPGTTVTPYVEIEYAKTKRTTTTAAESTEPTWNEKFSFDFIPGEDEMAFDVFLPGGVFIGRALLSFEKFGTDADLCFELADENNDVGGRLIVRVEPHLTEAKAGTPPPSEPIATPKAADPTPVESAVGPKTRLSISKVHLLGVDPFTCTLKVGASQRVCDTSGSEEYLYDLHHEEDVVIEVHTGGKLYGSAKLKGATLLTRSGTNSWVLLSSPGGPHVGKLLLTISSVLPLKTADGLLGSAGSELIELSVEVASAEGLPRHCNACVYLSIGDNDRATTKKADTASPAWGETFSFFVEEDETLSAKVFDDEEFVAEAIVPVAELLYVAGMHRQLEVKLLDRKRRSAGILVLGASAQAPGPVTAIRASSLASTTPSFAGTLGQVQVARGPFGPTTVFQAPLTGVVREYPIRQSGFVPPPVHLGQTTTLSPATPHYEPTIPGATVRYAGRIKVGQAPPPYLGGSVVSSRTRVPVGASSPVRTVYHPDSLVVPQVSARPRTAVA